MSNKSNASVIGVSTVLLALPLAVSPLRAAEGRGEPKKQSVKGAGARKSDKAQAQQSTGSASISSAAVVSESGTASNLVRYGLSVSLVNRINIADLKQFSKMIETQRRVYGLNSASASLMRCNAAGADGVQFISIIAKLVGSGHRLDSLVEFSRSVSQNGGLTVGEAGRFLTLVGDLAFGDAVRLSNLLAGNLRGGDLVALGQALKFVRTIATEFSDGRSLAAHLAKYSASGALDLASAGLTAQEKKKLSDDLEARKAAESKATAEKLAADRKSVV